MTSLTDLIVLKPQRGLVPETGQPIVAQAVLEERHTDELQITEHPVEQGAPITDHAYKRPNEVVVRYGWSPSLGALLTPTLTSLQGPADLKQLYQQLLTLQASRQPFVLLTGKRRFKNMLIRSIQETTDPLTEHVLTVTLTCREVILVQTRAVAFPPKAKQAAPKKTAATTQAGVKQVKPASVSPGGASTLLRNPDGSISGANFAIPP